MTATLSITVTYSAPSFFYSPKFLNNILLFSYPLLPSTILHLTFFFPQEKTFFAGRKRYISLLYIVSISLGIISRLSAPRFSLLPGFLLNFDLVYLFASLLIFLGATVHGYFKTKSIAVRLQSIVIFTGITVSLFVPIIDTLTSLLFKFTLSPNPTLFYLFFLTFFPLSIGYAIVRHDLFEFDVIVRRTYGYILSTASIIGIYGIIVSLLNLASQTAEFAKTPIFPIIFSLLVVFTFRPLHNRIQDWVDRFFYRQKYDYRKTIKAISEKMIRILDADQIYKTLIGSVVQEMSLENGVLLLPNPDQGLYQVNVVEGTPPAKLKDATISDEENLSVLLKENNEVILRHQIDLDPAYEENREQLQNKFESLSSELMLPLTYHDEIRGIISFGRKKSGKMFLQEDIDLLKTVTNQSSVALENVKLFEENIEKTRMEEELKIAHDIQVSMLPEHSPVVEGFSIAASSLPAREVGGDFYDFIEIDQDNNKKLGILVGDVAGKSVSGALVMAASRSIFRVLADPEVSVNNMMLEGNRRLKHDVKKGMFVALVYALLDPLKKKMTIVNAGQTQPIICSRHKDTPLYIETEGDRFPLGIVEDCDYQETTVSLKTGDTVVLYTDGIVEAMDEAGEMYGFDRFIDVIDKNKALDADALLRKLMADVTHFVGDAEQHDDLTIVVVNKIESI
jgi:serine phosphatase RsbU (regulator of sigma subunit)